MKSKIASIEDKRQEMKIKIKADEETK